MNEKECFREIIMKKDRTRIIPPEVPLVRHKNKLEEMLVHHGVVRV